MRRAELLAATSVLRLFGRMFGLVPVRPNRVVLATPRSDRLDGNLLALHTAMKQRRPELEYVLLLEPYAYDLRSKLAYFLRLVRGTYYLRTSALFIVDNAYLPVHLVPHPGTTVVQVWHAAGALKRFGLDVTLPGADLESGFLHHGYDYVATTSESARVPWSRAFGTPLARVLALGTPRIDDMMKPEAVASTRAELLERYPTLRGRSVILHAPTLRGRGAAKHHALALDARELRRRLPNSHAVVLKPHPNAPVNADLISGYDLVIGSDVDINSLFSVVDIFVTDYSSAIFEWATFHRPLLLLVGDLAEYERYPGLYLDYRRDMIGTQVRDTNEAITAILEGRFDLSGYDQFIAHHLGPLDGQASQRFIDRFLPDTARSQL